MGILDKIFKRAYEKDPQDNSEQSTTSADPPSKNSSKSVNAPTSSKTSCTNCDAAILNSTFVRNKGLCTPCAKRPGIAEQRLK